MSVCPSVNTAERLSWFVGLEATFHLSYIVYEGNLPKHKNKGASLWNVVPISQTRELENFATACQPLCVLLTQVDPQCDKLVMVVGRQFITVTVHLCVQHDGR